MTDEPRPDPQPEHGAPVPTPGGAGSPRGSAGLVEVVAQEVQTGVSSADADEHTAQTAPASEGYDELG